MSHVVKIKTEIRDAVAVRAACSRLGLAEPVEGTAQLFGDEVRGLLVELPDWRYPVCCDLPTGQVLLDNFEGRWGNSVHLDRFQQACSVEKARIEARRRGHSVTEQPLSDGSIKLTIQVNGGASE